MLVLTRKEGESLRIGDVRVTVVQLQCGQVRVAIEAPPEVSILREEVWERIARANREAAAAAIAGGTPVERAPGAPAAAARRAEADVSVG